jgi:hypothetical protein
MYESNEQKMTISDSFAERDRRHGEALAWVLEGPGVCAEF